jgi:purine-binding chemotaxis protein CheW
MVHQAADEWALATLVIFRCGEALCAFQREQVVRLFAAPLLSTPPQMPPALAGFANIAGGAVPVIDTARLLGLSYDETADPLYRHVLIVLADGAPLGLLVDRALDVRNADLDALTPVRPDTILNDCVLGDLRQEGRVVHVLDAERVLLAHEQARISDLRAAEQERLNKWAPS